MNKLNVRKPRGLVYEIEKKKKKKRTHDNFFFRNKNVHASIEKRNEKIKMMCEKLTRANESEDVRGEARQAAVRVRRRPERVCVVTCKRKLCGAKSERVRCASSGVRERVYDECACVCDARRRSSNGHTTVRQGGGGEKDGTTERTSAVGARVADRSASAAVGPRHQSRGGTGCPHSFGGMEGAVVVVVAVENAVVRRAHRCRSLPRRPRRNPTAGRLPPPNPPRRTIYDRPGDRRPCPGWWW